MKKMVASIATGIIMAGATVTTVSAAEYEVEKGDNLWSIAQEYNTSVDELVDINELKSTTIYPKQTLSINDSNDSNDTNGTYKVQKGDTLYGIGNEFGASVNELKAWNNLQSDLIVVGQQLATEGSNVEQNEAQSASASEATESSSSNESSSNESAEQSDESAQATAVSSENNTNEKQSQESSQDNPEGKTITATATAYTGDCDGCSGVTATGVDLNANPNKKVIAVDPDVIPLGSKVHVEGYGYATAADTGGAINGNKIDVHVPSKSEAYDWGVRTVDVTIVE
ncbi:MAG TPA: LysM peptidoglycan-binding domain-containing protein [Lentibacillus sp.]|uniref:3D domain-containing protein n=1 Tax=Lentibacillus sp. TaxID=1925746 RepID=UPI002B4B2793|nr:LysM peptidoglycan-binding domain-containing protein [Lentibacillus sp.]HLR60816.1 LysM peptidoglycan-binding domain-containing protein [Lentibacillus sp.]